jgi:hypothetical protein
MKNKSERTDFEYFRKKMSLRAFQYHGPTPLSLTFAVDDYNVSEVDDYHFQARG